MRKAPLRLACPACLGVALETATVADGARVRHCPRCGGTWLPRGQIARLRAVPARALRVMIGRAEDASYLCHGCRAPVDRDAAKCAACGWVNTLECPDCGRHMRRQMERGTTVDVCRPCESVWLDHHELSLLWAGAATVALAQANSGSNVGFAPDAGDLLEVFFHAPDLVVSAARGVGYVAEAGIEAAAHVPELLASTPGALTGLFEVLGDVAGTVFGLIAEILGGLFDGLG